MRFTIVYASATGHTEDIAERLNTLLPDSELKDLDRIGLKLLKKNKYSFVKKNKKNEKFLPLKSNL